jgi:hypothetical protein
VQKLWRILLCVWALPATLCGLVLIPFVLRSGGSVRIVEGVLEVHGGIATRLLKRGLPWVGPTAALTLGHVVFGCDAVWLASTRAHERVHVRQYERWGPFFLPAYLTASLILHLRGKDPYRDNPFEKRARAEAAVHARQSHDSLRPQDQL